MMDQIPQTSVPEYFLLLRELEDRIGPMRIYPLRILGKHLQASVFSTVFIFLK